MRIAFFDTHKFERQIFEEANSRLPKPHEIVFLKARLSLETAALAVGYPALCAFVNDSLNREVIEKLAVSGLKFIALRSAGYNHVDLPVCCKHQVKVARVPAYSPYAVAEHAAGLLMALNRKIHRAYARVKELNFSLDGLEGFDLNGKTAGILGTGKIGSALARILWGLGCRILGYDPYQNEELIKRFDLRYVQLEELYRESNFVFLQLPLTQQTHHIIDLQAISRMKRGVFIINTGRGALIDTRALIEGLKTGQVGGAGLDVYEEEEGIFFHDLSSSVLQDDVLARLLTFPNVVITAHQAFLTREALQGIAATTLGNIEEFQSGADLANEVRCQPGCRECKA